MPHLEPVHRRVVYADGSALTPPTGSAPPAISAAPIGKKTPTVGVNETTSLELSGGLYVFGLPILRLPRVSLPPNLIARRRVHRVFRSSGIERHSRRSNVHVTGSLSLLAAVDASTRPRDYGRKWATPASASFDSCNTWCVCARRRVPQPRGSRSEFAQKYE